MRACSRILIGGVSLAVCAGVLSAQTGPYTKTGEIPIGGTVVGFDYLNVDSGAKRLYVSNTNTVVVIDLAAGKMLGRIEDTPGVHGIAIAADLGRLITSNGRENKVSIVDAKTLQTLSKVDTGGANPDALLYEPSTKRAWVFNHTGMSAAEIDVTGQGALVGTIPLSGTAEAGASDPALGRISIGKVEGDRITPIQTVTTLARARTMALDVATHNLYVVGQKFALADPNAPPAAGRGGRGGPPAIPDSFHVAMFGMGK